MTESQPDFHHPSSEQLNNATERNVRLQEIFAQTGLPGVYIDNPTAAPTQPLPSSQESAPVSGFTSAEDVLAAAEWSKQPRQKMSDGERKLRDTVNWANKISGENNFHFAPSTPTQPSMAEALTGPKASEKDKADAQRAIEVAQAALVAAGGNHKKARLAAYKALHPDTSHAASDNTTAWLGRLWDDTEGRFKL